MRRSKTRRQASTTLSRREYSPDTQASAFSGWRALVLDFALLAFTFVDRRKDQSTDGRRRSHVTGRPFSVVKRSMEGHHSAGTEPRFNHMDGALLLALMPCAKAAAPPATSIASSSGVMAKFFVYHVRDCAANTNVMQVPRLITDVNTIAERLREAREAADLTQEELAERAGVSQSTIGNVESGIRRNPRELLNIAKALNVSAEWLKDGKLPMRPVPHDETTHKGDSAKNTQSGKNFRLAPVFAWARLESELYKDSENRGDGEVLPVHVEASERAKYFIVESDYPRFRIKRGWAIFVDPIDSDRECVDDEMYLFKKESGGYILAEFRRAGDSYEAIPDSGPPLDKEKHKLTVVAEWLATGKRKPPTP